MNRLMAVAFTGLLLVGFQKKQIDWRAFVPFLTTRNDVEADLGAPFSGKDYIWIYDTAGERVTIWYGGAKPAAIATVVGIYPMRLFSNLCYHRRKESG